MVMSINTSYKTGREIFAWLIKWDDNTDMFG